MREWYTHGDASAIRAQGESIIFFNTKLSQNFENFQISKHTRGIRRLVISWVTIYYGFIFFTNSHEVASAGSWAFKRVWEVKAYDYTLVVWFQTKRPKKVFGGSGFRWSSWKPETGNWKTKQIQTLCLIVFMETGNRKPTNNQIWALFLVVSMKTGIQKSKKTESCFR